MIGQSATTGRFSEDDGAPATGLATLEVLRLLSGGASGAILMALGDGPLRTKELTERIRGYTPRTVYRYTGKLAAAGLIDRHEERGVPSKVTHSLNRPRGQDLHDLLEAYAEASLSRLPGGEIGACAWGSLALLADLWESGMVDVLNIEPRSLTELSCGHRDLSYHQVTRRVNLLANGGFIQECPSSGPRRSYTLTSKARRAMALIVGIGRWRGRHAVPKSEAGLNAPEVATALRTVLPLVVLSEHGGKSFGIGVADEDVWASVELDGNVLCSAFPPPDVDGHARGGVKMWIDALLDGPPEKLSTEGDDHLIRAFLSRLHAALWTKWPDSAAAPPSAPAPGEN